MKCPPVIIDTNVLVAGFLTGHDDSPVARIVDGMLATTFPFAISEALLAEYRMVLLRDEMRKLHGLTVKEVDSVLVELARQAIVLNPTPASVAPDPGDQHLWELLAVRSDVLLVTGDKQLLEDSGMKGRVISPRQFIENYIYQENIPP